MKRHSNSSSSLSVASDPALPVLTAVDPLPEALPTQPPRYRQIKLALNVHAGDLLVKLLNRNALRKRQRQQLQQHRLSRAAQGRCLMLLMGRKESNNWWKLDR